jgi:hypothetical protein
MEDIFPTIEIDASQAPNLDLRDRLGQLKISKVVFVLVPCDIDTGLMGAF